MPKGFKIIGLLFILLSFSSCIELVEEIKINPDLSGNYHLYLKHDGLDFLFKAVPKNVDLSDIETAMNRLKLQEGIHNLKSDIKINKGKFSVQFDFSNAKSLSHALYAVFGAKQQFYNKSFIKVGRSKVKRPNLTPYIIEYAKSKVLLDELPGDMVMENIYYTYRLITPKDIKHSKPDNYSLSNQNEYVHRYSMKSLFQNEQSTKSTIRLVK